MPQSKRMWKTGWAAQNGNVGQNEVQAADNGNAGQNDIAPAQTDTAPVQTDTAPTQMKLMLPQLKLTLPQPKLKLLGAEEEEEAYGIQLQGCHLHNQLVAYYSCPTQIFYVCLYSNIFCLWFLS
ncbi:hypothetical protein Pyn_38098 [Prunus yedoensis var. nudiflora]|uniref:Uncharacterized protein n=1 Tax=Prunus yedoensis var. nudiflora TaxID=2094558 RepID=A0A314UIV7_PRUYE|nr:hypothetical protein Pyn_38098 [Prunus yedoensis var. nudiflora]